MGGRAALIRTWPSSRPGGAAKKRDEIRLHRPGEQDYDNLSPKLRVQANKQLDLLIYDLRYPSLHAEKYDERRDIWQVRISRDYRVFFVIEGDACIILISIP